MAQGFTGGLHGRQQVLRIDRTQAVPAASARACAETVARLAPEFDAVLLSDYRGGVVTEATIAAAPASGRPISVDSQGDLRRFRACDLIKINQAEAQVALAEGAGPLLEAHGPTFPQVRWLAILALYDLVFALLAYAVFDFLLEE